MNTGSVTEGVREREKLLKYALFAGKRGREDSLRNFYLRRSPLWPVGHSALGCRAKAPMHLEAPTAPGLHSRAEPGQRPLVPRKTSTDARDHVVQLLHGFVSRRDNGSDSAQPSKLMDIWRGG